VVFDYEERQSYSYLIIARDRGDAPKSTSATLIVKLSDVNDETPKFERSSYTFTTPENRQPEAVIGHVKAFDADSSHDFHTVYYFLHDGENGDTGDAQCFRVNVTTGEITNRVVLDREEKAARLIRITASNDVVFQAGESLSVFANVTVHVSDENDHFPRIVQPSSVNETFFVWESVPAGREVARVKAIDADDGINAVLSFSLAHPATGGSSSTGSAYVPFTINSKTGEIITNYDINADYVRVYPLVVEVRDGGTPRHVSSAHLLILVNSSADPRLLTAVINIQGYQRSSSGVLVVIGLVCAAIVLIKIIAISIVCARLNSGRVATKPGAAIIQAGYDSRIAVERAELNESLSGNSFDGRLDAEQRPIQSGSITSDQLSASSLIGSGGAVTGRTYDSRIKKEVTFSADAWNLALSSAAEVKTGGVPTQARDTISVSRFKHAKFSLRE